MESQPHTEPSGYMLVSSNMRVSIFLTAMCVTLVTPAWGGVAAAAVPDAKPVKVERVVTPVPAKVTVTKASTERVVVKPDMRTRLICRKGVCVATSTKTVVSGSEPVRDDEATRPASVKTLTKLP